MCMYVCVCCESGGARLNSHNIYGISVHDASVDYSALCVCVSQDRAALLTDCLGGFIVFTAVITGVFF